MYGDDPATQANSMLLTSLLAEALANSSQSTATQNQQMSTSIVTNAQNNGFFQGNGSFFKNVFS